MDRISSQGPDQNEAKIEEICRNEVVEVAMEMDMESSSPAFSFWDFIVIFLLRPLLAVGFVLSLISLGWLLAWKLVLVHVPLVQEIFGLRKKPVRSKPPTGRLSKIYSTINSQNLATTSSSTW